MRARALGFIALLTWFGAAARAQDARTVVDGLGRTRGAVSVKSLQDQVMGRAN